MHGNSKSTAYVQSKLGYFVYICFRHLFSLSAVTNLIFFNICTECFWESYFFKRVTESYHANMDPNRKWRTFCLFPYTFSIFGKQCFTFALPNCQLLTNSYFENSCSILISLAQNHEKLIFEYWLAPSWFILELKLEKHIFFLWIFHNHGHFRGWRVGGFFFFKLCWPQSYYCVSITKSSAFTWYK